MSGSRSKGVAAAAIIGCGDVATLYGETFPRHPGLALYGATDRNPERAATFTERFGGIAYPSIDALLDDERIDLVVNLTRQHAHGELTARCLEAGKHVYSEKPLAMGHQEAVELAALAQRQGLRLGSAPITYLGEAQQTVFRLVREGTIGTVRLAYAEGNWGRIERWHPRPTEAYEVGATFDVGVYPLTMLTALFGPARRVRALGLTLMPERTARDGAAFSVGAPDWALAAVELASGTLVRLTTSFYVEDSSAQQGLELHGDLGAIRLSSWLDFDAAVELSLDGGTFVPVILDETPFRGTDWARGPAELAQALLDGRPHRGEAAHAAHVVEALEAIGRSIASERPVEIVSAFTAVAA